MHEKKPHNQTQEVLSVQSVCFNMTKSNPPQLLINASGTVSTSGWSNAKLIPRVYVMAPKDGIQDFDFVATPPKGIVLQVLLPITAHTNFTASDWLKGIRIHAKTNSVTAMLNDKSCNVEQCNIEDMEVST